MPTIAEWLAGETIDGVQLPPAKVQAYRARRQTATQQTIHIQTTEKQPINAVKPKPASGLVGTELHNILTGCGISQPCITCGSFASQMNRWGVDGCDGQHRETIIEHLKKQAKQATWSQWQSVVSRGYLTCSSLLNEAIKRARTAKAIEVVEPKPMPKRIVTDLALDSLIIPPRESDRIIVTLAVGEKFQQLKAMVWPMLEAYAEKCGADLYCIDSVSSDYAMLGKFHLPEFFAAGYRDVLFLDCDIVIEPDAPSIFDEYPESILAMHDDRPALREAAWLGREYESLNASQGLDGATPAACYNTGVILMRRGSEMAFEKPLKEFPRNHTSEQSLINLNAARHGIAVTNLPRSWNEQWWPNRRIIERAGTHIYHWANAPHEQRVAEMAARLGVEAV